MQQREAALAFSVGILHSNGRIDVRLSGELDMVSCEELVERVRTLDASVPTALDMSAVTFLDSTALRSLWLLHQRSLASGGELSLCAPSESVLRVLDVTGLRKVFTIR
jgi:anti-sigma B factor antagonist